MRVLAAAANPADLRVPAQPVTGLLREGHAAGTDFCGEAAAIYIYII